MPSVVACSRSLRKCWFRLRGGRGVHDFELHTPVAPLQVGVLTMEAGRRVGCRLCLCHWSCRSGGGGGVTAGSACVTAGCTGGGEAVESLRVQIVSLEHVAIGVGGGVTAGCALVSLERCNLKRRTKNEPRLAKRLVVARR